MELRPYQKECIEIIDNLPKGNHLIVMATGLGKTATFANFKRRGRVLILSHRDELVRQPQKYFEDATYGVEKADEHSNGEEIVSASVQSLSKDSRLKRYNVNDFDTIIIDEAHHAAAESYKKIIRYFSGANRVIGVTATPKRGDNIRLTDVFTDIVFSKDLRWGIENGYLSNIRCQEVSANYTLKGVKKAGDDFSIRDLNKIMNDETIVTTAKAYMELCHKKERHVLMYAVSIQQCKILLETIRKMLPNDQHDTIQMLTGSTEKDERMKTLTNFNNGSVKCIINCMVLTEGTDLPVCDTIVNVRPTCSDSLYQQMVGRGTRLYKGKEYCLVIDIVPNDGTGYERHLCTAPTLFGVNPGVLSDKKKKKMQEMDLLTFCDEISIELAESTKNIDLFIQSVDRFISERQEVINNAISNEPSYNAIYEGFQRFTHVQEECDFEFGDLYVETLPDEKHRYRIKPNWTDEIYISQPDVLDKVTIEFRLHTDNKDKYYIGETTMTEAISIATDYCIGQPDFQSYSWSKSRQKIWRETPASDAQIRSLNTKYLEYGKNLSTSGLSKLVASLLIDIQQQISKEKQLKKRFEITPKQRQKTIERKKTELEKYVDFEKEVKKIGMDEFDSFVCKVRRNASAARMKISMEEKRREELQLYIKKMLADKRITFNGNNNGQFNRQASSAQLSFLRSLIRNNQEKNIFIESGINFEEMSVAEISVLIEFLHHMRDSVISPDEKIIITKDSILSELERMKKSELKQMKITFTLL